MLVLGHRGAHDVHPENTIQAFHSACASGADGVETDLRLSRDGEIVLYHDRVTPAGVAVESLSRAELSEQAGFEVPALQTALGELPNICWNLEIKVPSVVPKLAEVLRAFANCDKVIVTSFWHPAVVDLVSHVDVSAGFLFAHRPFCVNQAFVDVACPQKMDWLVWDFGVIDEALLRDARQLGYRNMVYGPTTQAEHDLLKACRVDGIITDHLEKMTGACR